MSATDDRIDALVQDLADTDVLLDQYIAFVITADGIAQGLRDQITALVAGDAATATKVDAAFAAAEALENKARAGLPGVPPVGGTPLLNTYADDASFMAAVTAYTGPEQVTKDGIEVKAGTTPALDYFTHSDQAGVINTTGPTS